MLVQYNIGDRYKNHTGCWYDIFMMVSAFPAQFLKHDSGLPFRGQSPVARSPRRCTLAQTDVQRVRRGSPHAIPPVRCTWHVVRQPRSRWRVKLVQLVDELSKPTLQTVGRSWVFFSFEFFDWACQLLARGLR
jgi:hypothetical protein